MPPHPHPTPTPTAGAPESLLNKTLETGAAAVQSLAPVERICAHLSAFHVYAGERERRGVEANHYCSHVNDEVRQCVVYDGAGAGARIIGIEYMISPRLFATLEPEEQKLWHSHVFEVKSGMLIMPKPALVPEAVWELAENKEMEEVIELYGKVYHLWQTDRGDALPLGEPKLMTSYTSADQFPDMEETLDDRDKRVGSDWRRKKSVREYIKDPDIHENADAAWK